MAQGLYLTHTTRNYTAVGRSFAALRAAHKLLVHTFHLFVPCQFAVEVRKLTIEMQNTI